MSNIIQHRKVIGMFDCCKRQMTKTRSCGSMTSLPCCRKVLKFRQILWTLALLQLVNQLLCVTTRIDGTTERLDRIACKSACMQMKSGPVAGRIIKEVTVRLVEIRDAVSWRPQEVLRKDLRQVERGIKSNWNRFKSNKEIGGSGNLLNLLNPNLRQNAQRIRLRLKVVKESLSRVIRLGGKVSSDSLKVEKESLPQGILKESMNVGQESLSQKINLRLESPRDCLRRNGHRIKFRLNMSNESLDHMKIKVKYPQSAVRTSQGSTDAGTVKLRWEHWNKWINSSKIRNSEQRARNGNIDKVNKLKIVNWNLGSRKWSRKRDDVVHMLTDFCPDVAVISEGNLYSDEESHLTVIENYNINTILDFELIGISRLVVLTRKDLN